MMDPVKKAEFVSALRSGCYIQGRGALRSRNMFCALGVKCDLEKVACFIPEGETYYTFRHGDSECWVFPPEGLTEAWGIPYEVMSEIVDQNETGKTFAEIADYIESNSLI